MSDLDLPDYGVVKAGTLGVPNSILVYGPPGKGKTVFGASICEVPGFERTLVLDVEGSAVSLGEWYPEADVARVTTAKDFEHKIEGLLTGKFLQPDTGLPYQAVVIDTLDKAQERQLDLFANSREARTKNGEENTFYKWNAIKIWTSKLADALHQADFLTIFIMHEDRDKDEATGKTTTTVMLQGKSQQIFPSVPDIVGYFNVTPVKEGNETTYPRTVDFRATDKNVAKQRFASKLDGIFMDPSMTKVFQKIEPNRFK